MKFINIKPIFVSMTVIALWLNACTPTPNSQPETASSVASSAPVLPMGSIQAVDVRQDKIGGDFTLTDGQGQAFTLSSLKGKVVILSFGFTNCPDVCPTELFVYHEALTQLGAQSEEVAVVFVSIDPERDTPDLIGRYVAQFNPKFIGLSGHQDTQNLQAIKQQYRIVAHKTDVKSDTLYNMEHSSGAYLLDKQGDVAYFAPYGIEAPQLAADVKKLLLE